MGKISKSLFIVSFIFLIHGAFAVQKVEPADSIRDILKNQQNLDDSTKLKCYLQLSLRAYNADEKLKYSNLAVNLAFKLNDKLSLARSYERLGGAYKLKGEIYKALDVKIKALNLFEELGHVKGISTSYNIIGTIYLEQENFPRAASYFYKAIRLNKEIDNFSNLAGDFNNLGETYRLWGNLDSAMYYFNKSLALYSEIEKEIGIAYAMGNIGLVYAEKDFYDSAEFFIQRATNILTRLGDMYPIAVYQTYMADIYRDKGEWKKALEYAHSSLDIAVEEGLKEQIRDASLKLAELYRDTEDYEKAYYYQNKYIIYRDSINNEDVIRKMADLRTEYELSKKQAEVDLMNQRRENQTLVSLALASVLILISVLAFFTYKNNLARKKTNTLLYSQKNKIESQRDSLEDLNNMKDKFFGIISHDLRSPVNSLHSIAQLLKHYVQTKNTKELEQLTELIGKSVDNLSALLDNLLSWALTQQGALPYNPVKLNIKMAIDQVLEVFKNAFEAKNISLSLSVPDEIFAWADEDSIHSLFRNIVNNAIKFTPKGGQVTIQASMQKEAIEVVISDSGVGMDSDQLDNLFKMDKKKVNKGTFGEKGSGLGMLLCREIIKLNKGKIWAESTKGEGTHIFIHLQSV